MGLNEQNKENTMDWLGDDPAEERDVEPELLRQRVEAAHSSEVNQAVGGLLTELDRYASCGDQQRINTVLQDLCRCEMDIKRSLWCTCSAHLNRSDGYRGLDVGHFECRQTGGVLGFTLSGQQLQTCPRRKHTRLWYITSWFSHTAALQWNLWYLSHRCPSCPHQTEPGSSSAASRPRPAPVSSGSLRLGSWTESVCVCSPAGTQDHRGVKRSVFQLTIQLLFRDFL